MKFAQQLLALGFDSYEDYLQSDHWHLFRTAYKNSGRSMKCTVRLVGPSELHHTTYVRLGAERFEDVTPLCRTHHEAVHQWLVQEGHASIERTTQAIAAIKASLPTNDQAGQVPGFDYEAYKIEQRAAAKRIQQKQLDREAKYLGISSDSCKSTRRFYQKTPPRRRNPR